MKFLSETPAKWLIAMVALGLCSACSQSNTTQVSWEDNYYQPTSNVVTKVSALGPSAGIF